MHEEPHETEAAREPVHLIVNERAGRGRGALAGAEAEAALSARGVAVVRTTTQGPGHAAELAHGARLAGAGVVAAVGGDGTLHEVANGLLRDELLLGKPAGGRRPLLGQVPVGSGNDYSKMLGVSATDPRAAAIALIEGSSRLVDVGILTGATTRDGTAPQQEIFLNNLGLAFAGEANAWIESTRGIPGYVAYLAAAAMALVSYKAQLIEVEVGTRKFKGRPNVVHVNLGRDRGGGVMFTPDAELDDGLFDVLILGELTRFQSLLCWKAMEQGGGTYLPDSAIIRGSEVVVRGPTGCLLHADGEVRKFAGEEVRARVVPLAIEAIFAPVHARGLKVLPGRERSR